LDLSDLGRILYAPQKAIKRIAEKPTYVSVLIIAILFIAANVAQSFALFSKLNVEQTFLPNGADADQWTANSTLWMSNGIATESNDSLNNSYADFTYYGNASLQFAINNSVQLWMELRNIGPLNCTGPDGFSKFSLRTKQIEPQAGPSNVTVYLFSSQSDYFYLAVPVANVSKLNTWSILTLPLDSFDTTVSWNKSGTNATWGIITGMKIEFDWATPQNVTLRFDGVFFHGPFKSLRETIGTPALAGTDVISYSIVFVLVWGVLAVMLYILARGFGGKPVWKQLAVVASFILIPMVLQTALVAVAYAALPTLRYPFELIAGVGNEGATAKNLINNQTLLVDLFQTYSELAVYFWSSALCASGFHVLFEFKWGKSIAAGVLVYLIARVILSFLGLPLF